MGVAPERDYTPATPNDDATRGGIARLATAIGMARAGADAANTPVLLLDAGDFMMGTLFELLATIEAPELRLMQALGYDATTLGNHELDWTPAGLAAILEAAHAKGVRLPILSSNISFSSSDPGDDALEALVREQSVLRPKLVKTVGGIKVGLFGLLGANAVQVTPQVSPLAFEAIEAAAARMVTELRETDQVDVVIALSHSGIDREGRGEDAALAAAVPGIDVIVSGHTHDTLAQPARVGQTLIVTAGSYTGYLGELAVTVTPPSSAEPAGSRVSVSLDGYRLLPIDDSLPGHAATQEGVEQLVSGLDGALRLRGLGYRQVVARTPSDLALPVAAEAPVGNLVSDAYRSVAASLRAGAPPALAIEANGQLRGPILRGNTGEIWFADLFRVLPVGIGPDRVPGYPLVSFYLNARDIRSGLELGGAAELTGNDVFLQLSGMKVEYDASLPPFQRVVALSRVTDSGDQPLDLNDTGTCYEIIASNYVAGLLGLVRSATGGLLSVEAKDADCSTPVDPTTRYLDTDALSAGVQELKGWQALLGFVSAFPDVDADGVADLPAAYGVAQGRITRR
jgi:5'-nucleotidase